MRHDGILKKWNDERGFGFIEPIQGGSEIFVHISAFPRNEERPDLNESISFEIEIDDNGKSSAVRVMRNKNVGSKIKSACVKLFNMVLVVVVLAIAGIFFKPFLYRIALENSPVNTSGIPAGCDGRTMCSQMTSCSEAKWFINNCPGTKMDGNHDGIPCVQQWCSN